MLYISKGSKFKVGEGAGEPLVLYESGGGGGGGLRPFLHQYHYVIVFSLGTCVTDFDKYGGFIILGGGTQTYCTTSNDQCTTYFI